MKKTLLFLLSAFITLSIVVLPVRAQEFNLDSDSSLSDRSVSVPYDADFNCSFWCSGIQVDVETRIYGNVVYSGSQIVDHYLDATKKSYTIHGNYTGGVVVTSSSYKVNAAGHLIATVYYTITIDQLSSTYHRSYNYTLA